MDTPLAATGKPPLPRNAESSGHLRPGRTRFRRWTWAHRAVAFGFLVWFALGGWLPAWLFQGNWNAARWFNTINLIDPLVFAETVLASRSVSRELVLGTLPLVAAAVLLGRIFCGWVCPLGLVLELAEAIRNHLLPRRKRPRQLARGWKYLVLAGVLLGSAVAGVPLFAALSPINAPFVWRGWHLAVALGIVAGLVLLEFWFPRVFCRALCPLGALYSLLGRWGLLRVRVTGPERLGCLHCTRDCPMGIDVLHDHVLAGHAAVNDPECTRCGSCTDRCLGDILHLGFAWPETASGAAATSRSPRR